MKLLLSDDGVDSVIAKALGDNPHWEVDAWGLFGRVAQAQLDKIFNLDIETTVKVIEKLRKRLDTLLEKEMDK